MVRWRRTTACERAAQWVSLDLDDELSSIERAGLRRHLDRCEDCRSASAEIGGFTRMLREAPHAVPGRPVLVAAPHRVRRNRRKVALAALAAAAVASGVAALSPPPTAPSRSALGFASVQQQHRFAKEHVGTEPTVAVDDSPPPPPLSLGLRALR